MRIRWMAVLVAPWAVACAHSSEPTPTPLTGTPESAVLVNDLSDPSWPTDGITLDSAAVTSDDRMRLFTRYPGGCVDHAAALIVGRAFAESSPPVLRARIAHDAKADQCKAIVARTFEFKLQPVSDHYRQSYGSRGGALVLDIGGQRVTYVFR